MARVLAYTSPARGHLFPLVPALTELRSRGHDVHVRTLASEHGGLRELGLETSAIAAEITAIEHNDHAARGQLARLRRGLDVFAERSVHEVGDLRAAVDEVDPDVVLVDVNSWGAQAVAEASGLPWGIFIPFPVWLPSPDAPPFGPGLAPPRRPGGRARDALLRPVLLRGLLSDFERRIAPVRQGAGVPQLGSATELFTRPPLALYFTAEPFEYPRSDWPAGFRLVGPCAWEPPAAPPDWLAGEERPLVLVSTSSEYQGDERLVATAFAALAEREDLHVVATMPAADARGIAVPGNARIASFCPHGPLLERAVAVVCHGGMGVTQKAIAAGVPVCAVPFGRDQLEVARRVEVSGAGVRLPARRLRADRLRGAVEQAIGMRCGAEAVARSFDAAGGGGAAASAVEDLLG